MNITPDQHETLTELARLPPPPAVRHDRDAAPAVLTEPAGDPGAGLDGAGHRQHGCLVEIHDGEELLVGGEPGVTIFAGYLDDPGDHRGQLPSPARRTLVRHR